MGRPSHGLAAAAAAAALLVLALASEAHAEAKFSQRQAPEDETPQQEHRRLVSAIDACPEAWVTYFTPEAMTSICICSKVASYDDFSPQQQACPTTTVKPRETTPGPTTTTLEEFTITVTTTTTRTTLYCEACTQITDGPTTGTTTSSLTSKTGTSTTTSTQTTSTSTEGTTEPGSTSTTITSSVTATITSTKTMTKTTTTATVGTNTESVTSTSATATSTTRTTTALMPCSICPLYHFLCPDGCTNCIAPGMCRTVYMKQEEMFDLACDHRKSISKPDPCVDFVAVQMSCPAGNLFPSRPVVHDSGAYPRLKCRTCGMNRLPDDGSPIRGAWAGRISWGPNQFGSAISETEIHSYKLYVVDAMYQKLGEALHTEEVRLWATLPMTCCDTSFYGADIDIDLPQNYTYFMVVPVTIAGLELNVGPVSARIVDKGNSQRVTSGTRRSLASSFVSAPLAVLAVLVTLVQRRERFA